jgi:hypothetical protein
MVGILVCQSAWLVAVAAGPAVVDVAAGLGVVDVATGTGLQAMVPQASAITVAVPSTARNEARWRSVLVMARCLSSHQPPAPGWSSRRDSYLDGVIGVGSRAHSVLAWSRPTAR